MDTTTLSAENFINRELSWLEFNKRVLEEAQSESTPLLERVKFLSIFSSNLDEFFMVRVAGLRQQAFAAGAPQDENPDGLKAITQLERIATRAAELVADQYLCWNESVRPELSREGIRIENYADVRDTPQLESYFSQTVFPILTPTAVDPTHPRPRYHNRALYVAAMLRRTTAMGPKELFAVVQVPQVLPRLIPVEQPPEPCFVFLEDVIQARLPELFGGYDVDTVATFRLTRDSDISLIEQESDDMLKLIEERLRARRRADGVRLEVTGAADERLEKMIMDQEQLRDDASGYSEVYRVDGPVDLTGLMSLLKLSDFEQLRDPPLQPTTPRGLRRHGEDLYAAVRRRDVLLHHPYDSFGSVVDFVQQAADDPNVLAIKQTLYRTSGDSPIIDALMSAAENGKHVTALVELQARFDEAANVGWARQLERAGVHVVYGFMDLKTHCKVSLVVRQEGDTVRRYVHLGTGNYNPTTARLYTDMGLFTSDEDFATDVSGLFNLLTGYSQGHQWRKLIVAPRDLHAKTCELIRGQTESAQAGRPARIFAKLNSLVDREVIQELYRASQAGVPIDLVIRGICCLRPEVPGVSDNIRVRSIVDRFLEHSRIMVFGEEPSAQIFFASSDWMPRNFFRRVEAMFPIESAALCKRVLHEIIPLYLRDNVSARQLRPDGKYVRVARRSEEPSHRCQEEFIDLHRVKSSTRGALTSDSSTVRGLGTGESAIMTGTPAPLLETEPVERERKTRLPDMKRRLIIMRHAKSSWSSGVASDHARPLNKRGRRDAPWIAEKLCRADWKPKLVLSSDSQRTRETYALMNEFFGDETEVKFLSSLYHAGVSELREAFHGVSEEIDCVLALGHNPGWEEAVACLTGQSITMTTANAALLETDCPSWSEAVANNGWSLREVIRPRG